MLIITIISFMLIAGTVARFLSDADEKEAEVLCQSSIGLRARTAIQVNAEDDDDFDFVRAQLKAVPPLCKTIDKKVSGDREHIKKQIADKMARCWWMFGEGRYEEILKSSSLEVLPLVFGFEDTEKECFNCYTLLIDEEEIAGGPIAGEEMVRYLSTTKYPRAGKDLTYLQYIQSFGGSGRVVFPAPHIEPGQAYSITFAPKNKEIPDGTGLKGLIQGVGGGTVAVAGAIVLGVTVTGIVCVLSAGGCLVPLAGLIGESAAITAAAAGETVVVSAGYLGAAKIAAGSALVAGSGAYVSRAGYKNAVAAFYDERDISSIYFDFAQSAQEKCGGKDIAGE